ncbi:MAG: hypothetical protein C4547_11800 [Phycisphaerales bacterium]|nr:MAG: hypothetical protein C4547_11800 [Phycisphaerales bacterium]
MLLAVGWALAGPVGEARAGGSATYIQYSSTTCRPAPVVSYDYHYGYAGVGSVYRPVWSPGYVAVPAYTAVYHHAPVVTSYTWTKPYVSYGYRSCATSVPRSYSYSAPSYSRGGYGYRSGYSSRGSAYGYSSRGGGYGYHGGYGHHGGYGYRSGYGYSAGYRSGFGSSGRSWSFGIGGSGCGTSAGLSLRYYRR